MDLAWLSCWLQFTSLKSHGAGGRAGHLHLSCCLAVSGLALTGGCRVRMSDAGRLHSSRLRFDFAFMDMSMSLQPRPIEM